KRCSMRAIAKNGIAMIRMTVILLASVIVRGFAEDLREGGGMGADSEPEAPFGCFLSKNVGMFMNERETRPVRVRNKNFFFDPLLREGGLYAFQKPVNIFAPAG